MLAALAALLAWTAPARADLYIANSIDSTLYVSTHHGDCRSFSGFVGLDARPLDLAVHPDGSRLYVPSFQNGTVTVLDTGTRSVVATIQVGGSPFGPTHVALHPNGTRAYALGNNRVTVIDTITNTVMTSVIVTGVARGIAVHPDGSRFYVATFAGLVHVIGVESNVVLLTVPVGVSASALAIHPDGSQVYVVAQESDGSSAVKALDTSRHTLVSVPVGGRTAELVSIAVHPDGSRVYVPSNMNQGETAIPGVVSVIDTATLAVTEELLAGIDPAGVGIDDRHVYVTNRFENTVSVFDNRTHAQVNLMQVGRSPAGVATWVPPKIPPLAPDVEVTAIELTQTIQDIDRSVNLIAGRRTFARVHVKSVHPLGATLPNVRALLIGVREECGPDGGACHGIPLGSVQSANFTISGTPSTKISTHPLPAIAVRPDPDRTDLNDSFLFELPWEWTKEKLLRVYAVVSQLGPPPAVCSVEMPTTTVAFDPPTALRIQFVRAQYPMPGNPSQLLDVSDDDYQHNVSWLQRAFPISTLLPGRVPKWTFRDDALTSRVDRTHADCQKMKDSERDLCAWHYLTTHPLLQDAPAQANGAYVLIPQGPGTAFFTRGACCTRNRLGAGPSRGADYGHYTTHELGHLLGREHPRPNSGDTGCGHDDKDPNYPYPLALIRPTQAYDPQTGLLGFDVGDPKVNVPAQVLGPVTYDLMSYCGPSKWVSDYTYRGVYSTLRNPGFFTPPVQGLGEPAPQMGDWLRVAGQIQPGAAEPVYMQARRVDRVLIVPERPPGNHSIRLTNAEGVTLAEYPFIPEEEADSNAFGFSHVVPFVPGAREIQIVDNSSSSAQVIGSKPISPNAPVVGNVGFQGTPGPNSTSVTLQWNASDPDGDELKFDIFVLRDGEVLGQPLIGSVSDTNAQIDITEFGGSLRFRVVATDGVQSAFSDSPVLNLAIKPPAPEIVMPGPEITIVEGQIVNFEGTATDPQDGEIPETGLSWSVAGSEPTAGSRFTLSGMPIGTHEVVLTATNSLGVSATATTRVIVNPNEPPQGPVLSVSPVQIGWHVAVGEQELQTATVKINNAGPGVLGFTASSDAPWLFIDESSGTAPSTLTVTVDPSGLGDGVTRKGTLTIAAMESPDQTIAIPVTLSVGNTFVVGGVVTPGQDPEEPPTCAADVTSTISITRAAPRLNRVTGRYVQQVTLQNIGSSDITGPISLVLDTLSSNATLANSTGQTECALPAAPYVNVDAGADNLLSAGESVGIVLEFTNPANQAISYGTRVLAGSEAR
jgi:YVTN family beta-propeller protein